MENMQLLYSVLAVMLLSPVGSLTNYSDEAAVLAFKSRITLDQTGSLTGNWSTRTSFCNWVGISCREQRVTALNLPNMGLRGTIPPQLANLSFLTIFNIENNSFHGQLPDEMGHLRRLELINLRYNQFTGTIPASIGALPQLRRLILSFNNFTGTIPVTLSNKEAQVSIDAKEYRKTPRPGHSSSPGHSGPNRSPVQPPL